MSTETAWPPAWTLKPTEGDPHDAESLEICEGIGWDLSFGFRLNVAHADAENVESPLVIGAHFSDADLARGFVQREVSPAQLEEFARLLLNLAAKHKQRQRLAVLPKNRCAHCGDVITLIDGRWTHRPGLRGPHDAEPTEPTAPSGAAQPTKSEGEQQ